MVEQRFYCCCYRGLTLRCTTFIQDPNKGKIMRYLLMVVWLCSDVGNGTQRLSSQIERMARLAKVPSIFFLPPHTGHHTDCCRLSFFWSHLFFAFIRWNHITRFDCSVHQAMHLSIFHIITNSENNCFDFTTRNERGLAYYRDLSTTWIVKLIFTHPQNYFLSNFLKTEKNIQSLQIWHSHPYLRLSTQGNLIF